MIYEKIYDMDNLKDSWTHVRASKSPAGIDHVTCSDFEKNLSTNLHTIQKQLQNESYQPLPVVIFNKKKEKGKARPIGISTIRDKLVQQAVARIITPLFDKNFLPCSYAYRPGRSALDAVNKASQLVKAGHLWALQMDVETFFDTINHDIVLDLIKRTIDEKPLIRLISRLLKAKIFREMGLFDNTVGSQQGSGLSPLLSNIYMHPVDHFLWNRYKDAYLRFSDDITLFSDEKQKLDEAQGIIERCLNQIKLSLNKNKTSITHLSAGIVYLGYYMDVRGRGPDKKSVDQLQRRLEAFDKLRKTDPFSEKLSEITAIIRGWHGYYKTLKPVTPPNILSGIALTKLACEFNEPNLAREILKKSKDFKHNHPDVSFTLGELFNCLGMQNQAMREYAQTIELDPTMEKAKEKVRDIQEKETDVYKAIEKIQLVLHHNPDYREGYEKLAHYYTELGLYGFAEKAHHKALEIDDESSDKTAHNKVSPAASPEKNDFEYQNIDLNLFLSIFSGRKDAHAKQWIDERGRWGFLRVERPLRKNDVYKHLKGDITLAVYPVTEDDKVNFIVFDVDTAKRKILETESVSLDEFRKKSHEDILRIKTVCDEMALKLYIEDSGYKGRHGWLFFTEPEPASTALELGQIIMKKAGGPTEDMIWELFPMGKSERNKSMIKLPLGINRKNNRRCMFLNDHNEVIENQALLIRTIKKNSVERLVKQLKIDKKEILPEKLTIPPEVSQVVEKCRVINHLISKARDTHYLTHYERLCLLYTLSFAGDRGCDYLHKVISYCINYDPRYTQQQIDRRKGSPISCARIMEYFPELTQSLSCSCKFQLPPKSYPSPILYLVQSEIERAYGNTEENKKKSDTLQDKEEQHTPDEPRPEQEEPLLNFETIFSSETNRVEPKEEQSKTAPEPDFGESPLIERKKELIDSIVDSEGENLLKEDSLPQQPETDMSHVWSLIHELMGLKRSQEKIRYDIQDIYKKLNTIFDSLNANSLSNPMGTIKRYRSDKDEIKWIIDM
jgi:group II intron reverse transcriptase/maturase